jgi:tetratricopeptide (TPR) repeat protein
MMRKDRKSTGRWMALLLLLPFLLGVGAEIVDEIRRADLLYSNGNFEGAKNAYQAIIEKDRKIPEVWYNLGNTYFRLGQQASKSEKPDRTAAEENFRKALEAYGHLSIDRSKSPELKGDAAYNSANCRVSLGQSEMAAGKLTEATGQFEAAVDGYLKYLDEDPHAQDARNNIEVAQGLNAEAQKLYIAILSYTPTPTPTITSTPTITGTPEATPTFTETPLTPYPTPTPPDTPTATPTIAGSTPTPQATPTGQETPQGDRQKQQQEQEQKKQEEQQFMSPQEVESFLNNLDEEFWKEFEVRRPNVERDW